jgi:hypothetical protein
VRTSKLLGLIALVVALSASHDALGDVVHLEGGGRVRGEIVSETATQVIVKLANGTTHVIKRDEIAKIERDRNPGQEYDERAKRLSEGDAEGWYQLGKFAQGKGLKEQADTAFKKAIGFDPEHLGVPAYRCPAGSTICWRSGVR